MIEQALSTAREVARERFAATGSLDDALDAAFGVLHETHVLVEHSQMPTVEEAAEWLASVSRHPRYMHAHDKAAAVLASEADVDVAIRAALANNPGDGSVAQSVAAIRPMLMERARGES